MKIFDNKQIEEYYDTTKIHYQRAWALNETLAMHYGYRDEEVRDFKTSLGNMNKQLALFGGITKDDYVLDAGCGIGGSSIYLAKTIGCKVKGITITQDQVEHATRNAAENGVSHLVSFENADFTKTPFEDETFDIIWGLESVVYDVEKYNFLTEARRILKKDGKVILGEYVKTGNKMKARDQKIFDKWLHAWAISDLATVEHFKKVSNEVGFEKIDFKNITPHVRKSSWRMYYGSFFLTVLSALYRIYDPKVKNAAFADNHYKSLYYQYPALRRNLWNYYFIACYKK